MNNVTLPTICAALQSHGHAVTYRKADSWLEGRDGRRDGSGNARNINIADIGWLILRNALGYDSGVRLTRLFLRTETDPLIVTVQSAAFVSVTIDLRQVWAEAVSVYQTACDIELVRA